MPFAVCTTINLEPRFLLQQKYLGLLDSHFGLVKYNQILSNFRYQALQVRSPYIFSLSLYLTRHTCILLGKGSQHHFSSFPPSNLLLELAIFAAPGIIITQSKVSGEEFSLQAVEQFGVQDVDLPL
jgi:hypothetical protein